MEFFEHLLQTILFSLKLLLFSVILFSLKLAWNRIYIYGPRVNSAAMLPVLFVYSSRTPGELYKNGFAPICLDCVLIF